jgi:hypothetical protein
MRNHYLWQEVCKDLCSNGVANSYLWQTVRIISSRDEARSSSGRDVQGLSAAEGMCKVIRGYWMQRLWWQGCARFIHDRGELDLLVVAVVQICHPDGLCYKDYQRQGYAMIISSRVVQGLSEAGGCKDY